jgi:hypothetical protein
MQHEYRYYNSRKCDMKRKDALFGKKLCRIGRARLKNQFKWDKMRFRHRCRSRSSLTQVFSLQYFEAGFFSPYVQLYLSRSYTLSSSQRHSACVRSMHSGFSYSGTRGKSRTTFYLCRNSLFLALVE